VLKFLGKTKRLALISSVAVLLPQAYAQTSLDNLDDDNSKATPRRPVTTGGHGYQTREKAKLEGRDGR
jgi:hypothetical protein